MIFPSELISFLRKADCVTALTGAGVSQESGLRTFRDAQVGMWAQYKPEELATSDAFLRNPKLVWDWYATRREKVQEVKPNPGHFALTEMSHHIPDFILVTQNIDGLHLKAGSSRVVELHGNLQRVKCFSCGQQFETWDEAGEDVPSCFSCGGMLRPDVVWFGESLPGEALETAVDAARRCQVFFLVGTSGLVQPAASLAVVAQQSGAVVVEINAEPTPLTEIADFAFRGKSGDVLPAFVQAVWEKKAC